MKYLIASAIIAVAFCSCKKEKSEPTSPYAKKIAGTRQYRMQSHLWVGSYTKDSVDTVTIEIVYVNDATLEVNSTLMKFDPSKSNDTQQTFNWTSDDKTSGKGIIYSIPRNSVYIGWSNYISAGGGNNGSYTSL